jgi:hypothetical protein
MYWLFEAKKRFGLTILGYMITSNHIHLLVPSRRARQNKALDPTALLGASGCKHPASTAMLAGQRRDY